LHFLFLLKVYLLHPYEIVYHYQVYENFYMYLAQRLLASKTSPSRFSCSQLICCTYFSYSGINTASDL
ncbi:MAG: hypothetical protein ABFD08_01135, partial [Syntrophomonas sp.]